MKKNYTKILIVGKGEFPYAIDKLCDFLKNKYNSEIFQLTNSKNKIENKGDTTNILMPTFDNLIKSRDESQEFLDKIKECEKIVNIPISRIIISNERHIGRSYSKKHFNWAERNLAKLSLKNNEIANYVIMGLFKYIFSVLEKYSPTICFGAPTAGAFTTVTFYVCKYLNIPFISCNGSVIHSGRHFWVSNWGSFNEYVDNEYNRLLEINHEPSHESLLYIQSFQKSPVALAHYQQMWNSSRGVISFNTTIKSIFDRILHRAIPVIKNAKIANKKPLLSYVTFLIKNYVTFNIQKNLYTSYNETDLTKISYVYYPFHLDPEMVLNVQAPFWHNQLNTIKLLSYNLPFGYKLLVREHRYNVGRRPKKYLEEIKSYPNVILIDAFDDQYKYIKNADLIVTVNGTTGFEGVMLDRQVLTLDRCFYDGLNLTTKYTSSIDFGTLILKAIKNNHNYKNRNKNIAIYLDAEKNISFSQESLAEDEINFIENNILKLDFSYSKKFLGELA